MSRSTSQLPTYAQLLNGQKQRSGKTAGKGERVASTTSSTRMAGKAVAAKPLPMPPPPTPPEGRLSIGSRVKISGDRQGTVRYLGPAHFADGEWVGVELDKPEGRNNGIVRSKRYFKAQPNHGAFVRPNSCEVLRGELSPATKVTPTPVAPEVPAASASLEESAASSAEPRAERLEKPFSTAPHARTTKSSGELSAKHWTGKQPMPEPQPKRANGGRDTPKTSMGLSSSNVTATSVTAKRHEDFQSSVAPAPSTPSTRSTTFMDRLQDPLLSPELHADAPRSHDSRQGRGQLMESIDAALERMNMDETTSGSHGNGSTLVKETEAPLREPPQPSPVVTTTPSVHAADADEDDENQQMIAKALVEEVGKPKSRC